MRKTLIFMIALFSFTLAEAQFSGTYDYENINTNAFTVPTNGLNNEQAYLFSIMRLNMFLKDHAASGPINTPVIFEGKFKVEKRIYSPVPENGVDLEMLIVRPNDNVERPLVLLTHGAGGNIDGSWVDHAALGTGDFAMRGYAVAIYQNPASGEAISVWDCTDNGLRSRVHLGYQYAVAATQYMIGNKNYYNINADQVFAGGASFGGYSSLSLAFADSNNFTNSIFSANNVVEKSQFPGQYFDIKGVFSLAGPLPDPDDSNMGDFIDTGDNGTAVVLYHGELDNQVFVDEGPAPCLTSPPTYNASLTLEGPLALRTRFENNGIPNLTFINCTTGHEILSSNPLLNTNFLYWNSNTVNWNNPRQHFNLFDPLFFGLFGLTYTQLQIHDIHLTTARVFKLKMQDITLSGISGIRTVSDVNGHLTGTTCAGGSPLYRLSGAESEAHDAMLDLLGFANKKEVITPTEIQADQLVVYPNPTSGTTTFYLNLKESGNLVLEIYDLQGKLIARPFQQADFAEGQQELQYDFAHLPKGVYIYKLWGGEEMSTGKIIHQ